MSEKEKLNEAEGKDIDSILPVVGEFGRFQIVLLVMLCLMFLPLIFPLLITFFVAHNPPWKCAPNSMACMMNGTFATGEKHYQARCIMARSDWEYTMPKDYSIVTQFDLYCGREGLILLTTSIFFVGSGFGAVVMGWMADRFGRKFVLFPCLFGVITVTALSALSPNVYVFVISRLIVGFFFTAVIVQIFVIASELVGPNHRPFSGSVLWIAFCLILSLLGLKAYLVRNWKILLLICTIPYYFVFLFYKFVPESLRWLRVHGKTDEAEKILIRVAKFNGKDLSNITVSKLDERQLKGKGGLKDIVWPPVLLLRTLAQCFAWFACGMVYFGISLAADDLGGSMYRDFVLSALAELPAAIIAIHLCNKYGRKFASNPPFYITGFVMICLSMIPRSSGLTTIRVFLGLMGKLFISISFSAIYIWSVELYPTSIRSVSMGCFQVTSRVGAASAPWVAKFLLNYKPWLPYVVMGVISILAGIAMHWMPETRNKPTLETIGDIMSTDTSSELSEELSMMGNKEKEAPLIENEA